MTSSERAIKCKVQFARTVEHTGRWRGKKASEYVKYKKVKKQLKPTSKFDPFGGYTSLDGNGNPLYVRLGKKNRPKFILAKLYNKKNESKKTLKTYSTENPKASSTKVSGGSKRAWREIVGKVRDIRRSN